jgi:cysteine desulfurase
VSLDRIYLDFNATSPLSDSVKDWIKSGEVIFANPSSQHSSGKSSRKLINESRRDIYETFHLDDKKSSLFFHSGATEATNTFARSFAEWTRREGRELLIALSSVDHPAVTSLKDNYLGAHVSFFELARDKELHYRHVENHRELKRLKEKNPKLVILYHHLWVHNETGLVSPLSELYPLREISDLFIHVDSVQAPGKIPDWQQLNEKDIFSFSAHKFGALKGVGFSFMPASMPFFPLLGGGGQQQNLRSGTENPVGAKTLALALQDLRKVNVDALREKRNALVTFLRAGLGDYGDVLDAAPGNSNTIFFYFKSLSSDVSLALFDLNGLMISSGSACSSGAARASIVLEHMGLSAVSRNGLRLSLSFALSDQEFSQVQQKLQVVLLKLKAQSIPSK